MKYAFARVLLLCFGCIVWVAQTNSVLATPVHRSDAVVQQAIHVFTPEDIATLRKEIDGDNRLAVLKGKSDLEIENYAQFVKFCSQIGFQTTSDAQSVKPRPLFMHDLANSLLDSLMQSLGGRQLADVGIGKARDKAGFESYYLETYIYIFSDDAYKGCRL